MKKLPAVVQTWIERRQISADHLPEADLKSIRENASFLQNLCGLSAWDLGRLLFPQSTSKGSQQTQTVKLLNRGPLEELARVPEVLGFKPSVIFRKDLRDQIIKYVRSLPDPEWGGSVFSYLPTCGNCGTASPSQNARFCSNCGKRF